MGAINKLKYGPSVKVFAVYGLIGGIVDAIIVLAGGSAFGGLGAAFGVVGAIISIIAGVIAGAIGGLIFTFLYNVLIVRVAKLEDE
jgi:hypothetical protein